MEDIQPQATQTNGQPQKPVQEIILPPHSNKMIMSIICTVFYCLISGIIAIVKSSRSNSLYNTAMITSDNNLKQCFYLQSEQENKSAQTWITLSLISGILYILLIIIVAATGALASL